METGREMENKKLDETALIKQAVSIYKTHAKAGREIPIKEIEIFQRLVRESLTELLPADEVDFDYQEKNVPRKRWTVKTEEGEFVENSSRFKDFRQTVGTAAMLGKFKFAGRDVGVEFVRLFFGDRDATLFKNVSLVAKEIGFPITQYSLTDMKNVYFAATSKIELGETFPAGMRTAVKQLGSFLSQVGADADKEKIFIEETVIGRVDLQKELETRLGANLTPDQISAEIEDNQDKLARLWNSFKVASLEQASDLISRILYLTEENETLKQFEKSGLPGTFFPTMPPALFANRAKAAAYMEMATEKLRKAQELPTKSFAAEALGERAKQYEEAAAQLQQASSDQEVAHE